MLKHQKKGLYKALSMLLAVVIILTAPIGTTQAYALEGEQPTVTDIPNEPPLGASEGAKPNEVLDSGTLPGKLASQTNASLLREGAALPEFAEDYPKSGAAQAAGSKKVQVLVKGVLPEGETSMGLGYVLLAGNDPAPTAEQIKLAGGKIPGATVITWGTQTFGGTETPITLTGVQDDTDYEFYAVLWKDDVFSEIKHLAVKTPVGSGDPGSSILVPPTGLQWDTANGIKAKWNGVTNATSYDVTLYKEGASFMLLQYPGLTETEVSFQSNIAGSTGNYYFTVQAKADGYTFSLKPASPIYSHIALLYGNVTIDNKSPKIGDTLTGSLVYGNNTGTLRYTWKADGTKVGIDAASYTVAAGDLGKIITLEITSSVETGARTSAATAAVTATAGTLEVSTPSELETALGIAVNGDTITLLKSITYTNPVEITGESITFALGGFDLTIDTSAIDGSTALLVTGDGEVKYTGTGKFSAIGNSTAVRADGVGSKLTVGYAETTRGSAYTVQATDGGSTTVNGNVLAKDAGTSALWATGGGKITVQGDITCAGHNSTGVVSTGTGSTVHVAGNITATAAGTGSTGVNSKSGGEATIIGNITASQIGITTSGMGNAGTVTVTGNISITGTATGSGVVDREGISAGGGGTILVYGSVSAAGEDCTGVYANGSTVTVTGNVTSENTGVVSTGNTSLRGSVTVDGVLTAGIPYIRVGSTPKTAAEDTKPSNLAGYLQYTDGTHIVYIKDPSAVITVANVAQLKYALDNVVNGGTIRLTANIDYTEKMVVDTKSFTLDVGIFTLNLNVSVPGSTVNALELKNGGDLALAGTGEFNINLTGGNASSGVYANAGSTVTVSSVTVSVTASNSSAFGVYAYGANSKIAVLGGVEVTGTAGGCGAKTWSTGEIRIGGIMTAPIYINLNSVYKAKGSGEVDGGYLKYSAVSNGPGIVWVKIAPAVCQIEDADGTLVQQYDTLPEALTTATDGQYIRLLQNITYEKSVDNNSTIKISGSKTIYLQMNNHDLTIRNTGNGSALELTTNAKLWVGETGNLTLDAKFAALNVSYGEFHSGGTVNAVLQSTLNTGINADHAVVDIEKGTLTGVAGGIYAGSGSTIAFKGPVTVNGLPTWQSHGVHLSSTGNTVSVDGNIHIANGLGTGVYVENGGTVTVGHTENPVSITSTNSAGIWTRQGYNTADITVYGTVTGKARAIDATGDADIKVFGNVKSTSTLVSVYAVEGFANSGDTIAVAITGNVEGPSGVKYHGNDGTISVTGNVTATGSAGDTVGVFASYGSVSVTGNVAAFNGIGAVAGENGEITIDGVLTGNTYVKVYDVTKTAEDKTLPTTNPGYHTYMNNSAVVWVRDGVPATTYLLTVQNGTGSGSYLPGIPVSITADTPAQGKIFDKWTTNNGGSFGNANSASTTFTMPSDAVTVTATYKDAPIATYLLTVVSGTGGGIYAAGTQVSIAANPPAQGKVFDKWTTNDGGSFEDAANATTTFTMPSDAVTVTATYKDAPVGIYTLTVSGSYAGTSGAGQYASDTQVSIHAGSRSNYNFAGWTTSDEVTFANASSATTTFTMPGKNISITANWSYIGGGGSPDSDSNPSITPPVASDWLERSGTSALIADAEEKGLGYVLTHRNNQYGVRKAAWPTLAGYLYWHNTMDGSAVQVRVYIKDPAAITSDLLVSGHVKGSEAEKVKALFEKYFSNKVRTIHMDQTGAWGQSVEIATKVNLTGMDITKLMIYSYDKATNTYHRIEKPAYWVDTKGYLHFTTPYAGDIVISVGPLALTAGLSSTDFSAEPGEPVPQATSAGLVWQNPFEDVRESDWFYHNVEYAYVNNLFSGASASTFSPNTPMTRGMLVTVLGHMSGEDISGYVSSFDDVADGAYYAKYTEWAREKGIVSGVGGNNFVPNAMITRQDVAFMLAQYASAMGLEAPKMNAGAAFADAGSIASYAKDAATAMQKAGIISGKPGGIFDPKAGATRAEVASMLHRFMLLFSNAEEAVENAQP